MKEHGILLTGEMVRAILAGRKTQTRRVIKPQPKAWPISIEATLGYGLGEDIWFLSDQNGDIRWRQKCPYGEVGDRLWVRETLLAYGDDCLLYKADKTPVCATTDEQRRWIWKQLTYHAIQSIFMPKWAARIWLENTNVRVERVQDISLEDIRKEGLDFPAEMDGSIMRTEFSYLWDSINAKPKPVLKNSKLARLLMGSEALNGITGNIACYVSYPWDDIREVREHRGKKWYVIGNPWVWVIEFKRKPKENE